MTLEQFIDAYSNKCTEGYDADVLRIISRAGSVSGARTALVKAMQAAPQYLQYRYQKALALSR